MGTSKQKIKMIQEIALINFYFGMNRLSSNSAVHGQWSHVEANTVQTAAMLCGLENVPLTCKMMMEREFKVTEMILLCWIM